jgi:hypothetical protein
MALSWVHPARENAGILPGQCKADAGVILETFDGLSGVLCWNQNVLGHGAGVSAGGPGRAEVFLRGPGREEGPPGRSERLPIRGKGLRGPVEGFLPRVRGALNLQQGNHCRGRHDAVMQATCRGMKILPQPIKPSRSLSIPAPTTSTAPHAAAFDDSFLRFF